MSKPVSARPVSEPPNLSAFTRFAATALLVSIIGVLLPAGAQAADRSPAAYCSEAVGDLAVALLREPGCGRDGHFMYQLGVLLNQAGRYGEALDRLEGALLLAPELWPAHLQYALALDAVGERASALSLLQDLRDNPAADADTRQKSLRLLAYREIPLFSPRRTVVGLSTGYDDNLLGVTRNRTFELTLPDQLFPVELDDSQRQRGGRFLRINFSHEDDLASTQQGRWHYTLIGSHNWSLDYSPASLTHLGLALERTPGEALGVYGQTLLQALHRGGKPALYQWQLGGGLEWTGAAFGLACRMRIGGQLQASQYPASPLFDGRYLGGNVDWVCPREQLQVQLRVGADFPEQAARAGGTQRQYDLRVSRHFAVAGGDLSAEFDYFRQADSKGYSPLLENGAARRLDRRTYRLEYRWEYAGLSPYVGFEWLDQTSNLPLFSPMNRIFTLGFRQLW